MNKLILFIFLGSLHVGAADLQVINTNGVAEKYIEPNMVVVSVETFGLSEQAKSAQERQAQEYQRIKSVVEKFKIKKDDFITENISLVPQYRYDEKTQINKTVGFRVSHQIKVIIRQKNDVGGFLDEISSTKKADFSGVTISSISWDSDSRKSISEGLINEAVNDARKKADRLAQAAGVKIRGVQTLNFNDTSYYLPAMYEAKASLRGGSTELGSGSIKVRTEVSIQYRIE